MLPKLSILNLVATAELKQSVDLTKLVYVEGFLFGIAIYRFAYLKDQKTKAKVSIFSTGKMICVGAKNLDDAKHDLNYANKKLAELGLVSHRKNQRQVSKDRGHRRLGRTVDIERLSTKLPNIIYEPEQFPVAIYYAKELEGASILIFANGKVGVCRFEKSRITRSGKTYAR